LVAQAPVLAFPQYAIYRLAGGHAVLPDHEILYALISVAHHFLSVATTPIITRNVEKTVKNQKAGSQPGNQFHGAHRSSFAVDR
jgi:hypothetical protein